MPKSKHRRKPGGKAIAHPGRDKNRRVDLNLLQQDQADQERLAAQNLDDLRKLPLLAPLVDKLR
jgi:hypothetical protein